MRTIAAGLIMAYLYAVCSAAIQTELWVSRDGAGTTFSQQMPGALCDARDRVRSIKSDMTGDIVVYLLGGTYLLDSAFVLRPDDGGVNGHSIIYRAAPGETPVISGGVPLSGWSLHDNVRNIWRSYVGTSLQTRQLFVNGTRAQRARGPDDPAGYTKTGTGYTTTDVALQNYANISDMEVVGYTDWKCYRCGIASISGSTITIKQPCWDNSQAHAGWILYNPKWIENAYELLDEPGEWYLNRTDGYLYYKPRAGENVTSMEAIAAVRESLLVCQGTVASPVRNISFDGITFSYATWLKPNTDRGYPELQATYQWGTEGKAPANVIVNAGRNIRFERCTFAHLGATGLALEEGCQRNSVVGCAFYDISANGIHIGNINDTPSSDEARVRYNIITNNFISQTGAEYKGAVGIFAGYTDSTVIANNEIANLPYTGISTGWGWSEKITAASNNKIHHNLIRNVMLTLIDGGAIYALSGQHGTEVAYNYIRGVGNNHGLYPDLGSSYMYWHHNVVRQTPRWLHMWTDELYCDTVENNWHETTDEIAKGTNCVIRNNPLVTGDAWPQEALDVMAGAGIQEPYRNVKPSSPTRQTLLGWWKFDETAGDTAFDSSGNGYNGHFSAGAWSEGRLGGSLDLDGTHELQMSGPAGAMNSFTVAFWLNPRTSTNWNQALGAGWGNFLFHTDNNGSIYCGISVTSRFSPGDLGACTLTLNEWQHFAYTFDFGDARFYKDGRLIATSVHTLPLGWTGFGALAVDGKLDEMRIYRQALDSSAVALLGQGTALTDLSAPTAARVPHVYIRTISRAMVVSPRGTEEMRLSVTDMSGKTVLKKILRTACKVNLKPGVYVTTVYAGAAKMVRKVMIR